MQVTLRRNRGGIYITPVAGRFAGKVVARAERVNVLPCDIGVWDRPVSINSVWGLETLVDAIHTDPDTLKALSLSGGNRGARRLA